MTERGESKREIVQYKYNILSYYNEPVPVDKRKKLLVIRLYITNRVELPLPFIQFSLDIIEVELLYQEYVPRYSKQIPLQSGHL